MAQQANLQAASRTATGKGAARSLRRDGKVPGVIYGHGREAEAVTIDKSALNKMLIGISAGTTILDVVVDGRDMGTVVFPDADLKIFLVADSRERALRRLRQRGTPASQQVLDDETIRIKERDERDAKQTVPAADAVTIDTTGLNQAEQVEQIVSLSKQRAR